MGDFPRSDNPITTQDDIIVGGASGTPTRLAKGSDSQVLTVDPTTHHLVWATPSGVSLTDHTHAATGSGSNGGGATLTPGTLNIPYTTSPNQTAEGQAVWDSDDDVLTIGTGSSRKTLVNSDDSRLTDARPVRFKIVKREAGGNKTTTSTTFAEIDSTNLSLALTLAVSDIVEITFTGQVYSSAASNNGMCFDCNVIQPTSGTIRVCNSSDHGAFAQAASINRTMMSYTIFFTATEVGSHTFRPVWLSQNGSNTVTLANSASSGFDQTAINFSVINLGPSS